MRRRFTLNLLFFVGLTVPGLFAAGCGGDDPSAPVTMPADINEFMEQVPEWESYSPTAPRSNLAVGDPVEEEVEYESDTYNCTTTEYNLTDTPEKMTIFNPDAEILWLGSMLQGDGYRDGLGSLQELPIRQRGAITVFIDLLSENQSKVVENPSASTVGSAVGELIEQAELAGHVSGSNVFFDQRATHSVRQAAIDLGVSARYLGTTVESELDFDKTVEERTLTAYFQQRMFTASMELPQTPAALFSADFTDDLLAEQIRLGRMGPENPPTFISSIVYGRMLMLTMTSTYSYERMRAALSASRDAIGGITIDSDDLEVLSSATMKVSTVGGNDEGVLALLRTGRLGEYFSSDAPLTSARPLSYTVRPVANSDNIAKVSETTRYSLKECDAQARIPTGATYRVKLDKLRILEYGCDPITSPVPEVYYNFDMATPSGSVNLARRSAGSAVSIERDTDHFINDPARDVTIRGSQKFTISGDAWDYDSSGGDEHIGSWSNLNYGTSTNNGQRYFTREGAGCKIRLYYTITRIGDVFN